MARQANEPKQQKAKSIEETLWDSANKLRGSVEPAEYKHVVLGLIFLWVTLGQEKKDRKDDRCQGYAQADHPDGKLFFHRKGPVVHKSRSNTDGTALHPFFSAQRASTSFI